MKIPTTGYMTVLAHSLQRLSLHKALELSKELNFIGRKNSASINDVAGSGDGALTRTVNCLQEIVENEKDGARTLAQILSTETVSDGTILDYIGSKAGSHAAIETAEVMDNIAKEAPEAIAAFAKPITAPLQQQVSALIKAGSTYSKELLANIQGSLQAIGGEITKALPKFQGS